MNVLNEKLCPSCGYPIEIDENINKKTLCYYCFYRSNTGISKLIVFKVMKESGNKWMTKEEITELVNEWRKEHDKPLVKPKAVYNILHRYSQFHESAKRRNKGYLVLKRAKRINKAGRPRIMYKLSSKLLRRVDRYESRLIHGLPINSKVNKGKKFKMTIDYTKRSHSIANNVRKGEYEPYRYMIRGSY